MLDVEKEGPFSDEPEVILDAGLQESLCRQAWAFLCQDNHKGKEVVLGDRSGYGYDFTAVIDSIHQVPGRGVIITVHDARVREQGGDGPLILDRPGEPCGVTEIVLDPSGAHPKFRDGSILLPTGGDVGLDYVFSVGFIFDRRRV